MLQKKPGGIPYFIPLFILLGIFSFSQAGCSGSKPEDYSCQNYKARIDFTNTPPSQLNVGTSFTFNIAYRICEDYVGGNLRFSVQPPSGESVVQNEPINRNNLGEGTIAKSYTFSMPGKYIIWSALAKSNEPTDDMGYIVSHRPVVQVGGEPPKVFKIIEVEQGDNILWPNYSQGSTSYNGKEKRNKAFNDAKLAITVDHNEKKVEGENIFLSNERILEWTVLAAGGTFKKGNLGLDPKVPIICAIYDVAENVLIIKNTNGGQNNGYTIQGFYNNIDDCSPTMAYVLCSRIKNQDSDLYSQIFTINGSAIHELGHCGGITGDDPLIIPAHSGSNVSKCIMFSPLTNSHFLNPTFCTGHGDFIRNFIK